MLTKCFLFFKIGLNVLVETFLKRFFGYFSVLSKDGILCYFFTHHTGVKISENRVFVIHHNGLKNFELNEIIKVVLKALSPALTNGFTAAA